MLNPRKAYPLLAFIMLGVSIVTAQSAAKVPAKEASHDNKAFDAEIQKLRDTWVQEFNAGHADKVAALYASEAVLMRWDGSVHGYDSILAELQKSITGGAHDYVVHSLHTERSGDIGYDTGAYNVTLRDRVVEGNYLVVVKLINGQWKIVAHTSVANPAQKP